MPSPERLKKVNMTQAYVFWPGSLILNIEIFLVEHSHLVTVYIRPHTEIETTLISSDRKVHEETRHSGEGERRRPPPAANRPGESKTWGLEKGHLWTGLLVCSFHTQYTTMIHRSIAFHNNQMLLLPYLFPIQFLSKCSKCSMLAWPRLSEVLLNRLWKTIGGEELPARSNQRQFP